VQTSSPLTTLDLVASPLPLPPPPLLPLQCQSNVYCSHEACEQSGGFVSGSG